MNNRAQISTEYLIILAVFTIFTAVVTALAFNFIKMRETIEFRNNTYKKSLFKMLE